MTVRPAVTAGVLLIRRERDAVRRATALIAIAAEIRSYPLDQIEAVEGQLALRAGRATAKSVDRIGEIYTAPFDLTTTSLGPLRRMP